MKAEFRYADSVTSGEAVCPMCGGRGWSKIVRYREIWHEGTYNRTHEGEERPMLDEGETIERSAYKKIKCDTCKGKGVVVYR